MPSLLFSGASLSENQFYNPFSPFLLFIIWYYICLFVYYNPNPSGCREMAKQMTRILETEKLVTLINHTSMTPMLFLFTLFYHSPSISFPSYIDFSIYPSSDVSFRLICGLFFDFNHFLIVCWNFRLCLVLWKIVWLNRKLKFGIQSSQKIILKLDDMFVRLMVEQHNMYVDVFNDVKVDYYYNT